LTFLAGLSIESLPGIELILVDNASSDHTVEKSLSVWEKLGNPFKLHVLNEPKLGLMYARELGMKHARFSYWLFCDDDNRLDSSYAQRAWKRMEENAEIGVLGGLGLPDFGGVLPEFNFQDVQSCYAVGPQFHTPGEVSGSRNVVYGAGMVVRAEGWDRLLTSGYQPVSVGRQGERLSSGEDAELCLAMRMAGYKIWYDPELLFHHFIHQHRLKQEYLDKLQRGITDSNFISNYYLRFLRGDVGDLTSPLWLKELMYVLYSLVTMGFGGVGGASYKKEFNRMCRQVRFLIRENSGFDRKLLHIQKFYRATSAYRIAS